MVRRTFLDLHQIREEISSPSLYVDLYYHDFCLCYKYLTYISSFHILNDVKRAAFIFHLQNKKISRKYKKSLRSLKSIKLIYFCGYRVMVFAFIITVSNIGKIVFKSLTKTKMSCNFSFCRPTFYTFLLCILALLKP